MGAEKAPDRYLPRHMWYLADALLVVRALQVVLWPLHCHVALGGGVLNHGYSDADLDLYVLPIYGQWGHDAATIQKTIDDVLSATSGMIGDYDPRHDECFQSMTKYMKDGKRIDVFVVRAKVT